MVESYWRIDVGSTVVERYVNLEGSLFYIKYDDAISFVACYQLEALSSRHMRSGSLQNTLLNYVPR